MVKLSFVTVLTLDTLSLNPWAKINVTTYVIITANSAKQ